MNGLYDSSLGGHSPKMIDDGTASDLPLPDDRHTTAEFTAHWTRSNEDKPKLMPHAYPDVMQKLMRRR